MNRNVRMYGIVGVASVLLGGALFYWNETFAAPPLVLDDDEEMLLLGGDDVDPETVKRENAARELNGKCHVCHGNYIEEDFAKKHALGKIACFDCHGESVAHRNDENHVTPPDRMFCASEMPDEMIECCESCHDTHDVAAKDVLTRYQERNLDKKPLNDVTCMDCHGTHQLAKRTVQWNKKTGELIPLIDGIDANADRTNTLDLFKDRQSKNYGLGDQDSK